MTDEASQRSLEIALCVCACVYVSTCMRAYIPDSHTLGPVSARQALHRQATFLAIAELF